MKITMLPKGLALVQLAGAVLLVAGVLSFAGPCVHDDGSMGGCQSSFQGILGAGVVLVGTALAQLAVNGGKARAVFACAAMVLGLFAAFAPGNLLGLCMMETMHCRAVMQPFALICGITCALLAALAIAVGLKPNTAEGR